MKTQMQKWDFLMFVILKLSMTKINCMTNSSLRLISSLLSNKQGSVLYAFPTALLNNLFLYSSKHHSRLSSCLWRRHRWHLLGLYGTQHSSRRSGLVGVPPTSYRLSAL